MSGWAKAGGALGALFNPTPAEETDAYRTRVAENVGLEQKMAAARREQARAMALDAVMNDESLPAFQRNILAAELGTQFAGLQQGNLRAQELGLRDEAFSRFDAAGYAENAPLAALANDPIKVNDSLAGGMLQGNAFKAGAPLAVTELGLGELVADQARANASNASAAASNARAGLYAEQATNPDRFRAPPRAPASKALTLKQAMEENTLVEQENRVRRRNGEPELPLPHDIDAIGRGGATVPAAPAPTSTPPATPTIPPRAIAALQADPSLAYEFDLKYGAGASSQFIKGR